MSGKLALMVGNGAYANDVATELKARGRNLTIVSLLPRDISSFGDADHFASLADLGRTLDYLSDQNVEEVIFAGDLGLIKSGEIVSQMITTMTIAQSFNLEYIWAHRFNWGPVSALQFVDDKLQQRGIRTLLASDVLPSLKTEAGYMCRGHEEPEDVFFTTLLNVAIGPISDQPRSRVRQAATFDDFNLVRSERESTDDLLDETRRVFKPQGAIRSLIKVCPPKLSPTMDAPVIGPDTIKHCSDAYVDLVILDCRNGIICRRAETLALAASKGITVYGVDPGCL